VLVAIARILQLRAAVEELEDQLVRLAAHLHNLKQLAGRYLGVLGGWWRR
jgi:hypothetical protein